MMRGPLFISNHGDAVRYFNQLIIDLKKKEMGLEHDAITMERLAESAKHIRDIQECKRMARTYR